MKTLFIEARYIGNVNLKKESIEILPKKIGLVSTLQFSDKLNNIKKILEKNNKKVFLAKGNQKYEGQILGCDVSAAEKIKDKINCFLYIGDGSFHPIALGLLEKDVFIFNPFNSSFKKFDKKIIDSYRKKKKIRIIKFLNSTNIGVVISTKSGQYYPIDKLIFLEKKYKDKKFYFFITDTINYNEFENFPFIECWVNTACPRIFEDFEQIKKPLINVEDI